jgi:hypothetical protein
MNEEFERMLIRHFTPGELAEFLQLGVETLIDRFDDEIYNQFFDELCEEIGYEPEEDE